MKPRIVAVSQGRLSSTRLPEKIIQKVGGISYVETHLTRVKKSKYIDQVILAIANDLGSEKIIQSINDRKNLLFSFGSVDNVLDRYYSTVKGLGPDYVVRVTTDCPLIDPEIIDKVIKYALDNGFDYVSNALEPTFPDGMDIEIFKMSVLETAWRKATDKKDLEHVTPYIWKNFFETPYENWKIGSYKHNSDLSGLRLTLDYKEDAELIEHLIKELGQNCRMQDCVEFLNHHPEIRKINSSYARNEGY